MPNTQAQCLRAPAETLLPLAAYSIDPVTGFVPGTDPLPRLPAPFEPWEQIAPDLSGLLRTRRIRPVLRDLPRLDIAALSGDREEERALLLLTMFANAWGWGGAEPDLTIPSQISIPLASLASRLDRPPIVHYASITLQNWQRLDRTQPVASDNARMQVQFLGGVDEDWFFIASLGVELAGAPLLSLTEYAVRSAADDEDAALADLLDRVAAGMGPVLHALERMREWCDPHVFYHRVRPYLAGWPAPGAVYAGVSDVPLRYVGGSAGQSSLIQALDALLGVDHDGTVTGPYLRDMRRYMPVPHRNFVESVERISRVRARATSGSDVLRAAYNNAVEQVDLFRRRHIGLAHEYVAKPSGMASGAQGTGGTDFAAFLRDARVETARCRL